MHDETHNIWFRRWSRASTWFSRSSKRRRTWTISRSRLYTYSSADRSRRPRRSPSPTILTSKCRFFFSSSHKNTHKRTRKREKKKKNIVLLHPALTIFHTLNIAPLDYKYYNSSTIPNRFHWSQLSCCRCLSMGHYQENKENLTLAGLIMT